MQETRVRPLSGVDPTCCRATKPARHNYWACALKPGSHSYWSLQALEPVLHNKRSPCSATREARALQQEKPLTWEARALQLESRPCLLQLEKSPCSHKDPAQPKIRYYISIYLYLYLYIYLSIYISYLWDWLSCYSGIQKSIPITSALEAGTKGGRSESSGRNPFEVHPLWCIHVPLCFCISLHSVLSPFPK